MSVYAGLKSEFYLVGRVVDIAENELTIRSAAQDEIPPNTFYQLDLFTSERFYIRGFPVKVLRETRSVDDRTFSNLVIRRIKLRVEREIPVGVLNEIKKEIKRGK